MPAPITTYTPPPPPVIEGDLLVKVEINRDGDYPSISCSFRAVGEQAGTNALGYPKYPAVGQVYVLLLDSRHAAALQRIGVMMQQAAARVVAGEDFDSAMANEGYDLLADCVALDSTADMFTMLGVTVTSVYNPFPA